MTRRITKISLFATAAGVAWACSTPTDACGCPPTRSSLAVIGTLRDASGAPMGNTVFVFEATSVAFPNPFPSRTDVRTDATGTFAARAYSTYSPGVHSVVARFVRTPGSDTVRIALGSAQFNDERQTPDTLRVALRLP